MTWQWIELSSYSYRLHNFPDKVSVYWEARREFDKKSIYFINVSGSKD